MKVPVWVVILGVLFISLAGCSSDKSPATDGDTDSTEMTDGDTTVEEDIETAEIDGDETDMDKIEGDETDGDTEEEMTDTDMMENEAETDGDIEDDIDMEEESVARMLPLPAGFSAAAGTMSNAQHKLRFRFAPATLATQSPPMRK